MWPRINLNICLVRYRPKMFQSDRCDRRILWNSYVYYPHPIYNNKQHANSVN